MLDSTRWPGATRRSVLKGAAAVAAGAAVLGPRRSWAARPALPIPAELRPDANGAIALTAQTGTMDFGHTAPTPTYGINGPFLGPAIRLRRGERAHVNVRNALPETVTVHWHGLIIPGEADGGPHQLIAPGKEWNVEFGVDQPAATLWFHPHVYPTTAELVIKGLAGLLIIEDEESDGLGLPSRWGVDDIPIILQDRRFSPDGTFFHRFNLAAVTVGALGDTVLVNGAPYPEARTAKGWLRLRILNGSNARSYRLAASDGRTLYVVGSDGGLLEQPVARTDLVLQPGERFEVLVDARDGAPFDLVTLPVAQAIMRLPPFDRPLPLVTLDPQGADGGGGLPDRLVDLPSLPDTPPPLSQTLTMQMYRDDDGMGALMKAGLMKVPAEGPVPDAVAEALTRVLVDGPALTLADQLSANGINGAPFKLDRDRLEVPRGRDLRWRIEEGSDKMLHPVHIHGCQFRILTMDGEAPPPHLAGYKDTATISAGGSAEILIRFPYQAAHATPYMAHCHILEHEDSGMMMQFMVA